jgi:hypothetical protein
MLLVSFTTTLLYVGVAIGQYAGVKFGPGYDFHVSGSNRIIRAETTYTPGAMEKNITGISFLWPGIWNPRFRTQGDLIQTVIQGSRSSSLRAMCKAKPGQWLVRFRKRSLIQMS